MIEIHFSKRSRNRLSYLRQKNS